MRNRVLVVDLDGTLYQINTFHYFIKFLIFNAVTQLKLIFLIRLLFTISKRLFLSHAKVKYDIMLILDRRNDIDYNHFIDSITSKKRELKFISESDFSVKILATAAPLCYSEIIAKREGYDACLATEMPLHEFDDEFENKRSVKKNKVLSYLKSLGLKNIDTFVTDHSDDLPLLKIAEKNYVIAPDQKTQDILKQNRVSFELIK